MPTPYHIVIAPAARRQVEALPLKQQKDVIKLLDALAINPRPPGAKKIEGMNGLYREELEQLRLIYKVEDSILQIISLRKHYE